MANLKVVLEIDNQGYIRGIKAADGATKDFANDSTAAFKRTEQSINQLSQRTDGLTQGFGKLRSAIAGVAIGAFIGKAMIGADAIADLSDATDLSVGKLLEFEKAIELAGGKGEDAAKAITTFYASIQEANSGSDKTIEQFAKLGVSFNDLKTLSESDLLDKTLAGFANITDPILKSTIAVDIFSKAFRTVDPNRLSAELDKLRGTLSEQERSTIETANAIERFDKFVGNLKGAVILLLEPLLKFSGAMNGNVTSTEKLAETLKVLVAGYIALRTVLITSAIAQATLNALQLAGMAKNPLAAGIAGVAAITAGTAAYAGMMDLMKQVEDQAEATGGAINGSLPTTPGQPRPGRAQEAGKELTSQLSAVKQLAEGYRRAAQANMDRLSSEVDILGKSEYEIELTKAQGEINKRYGDQAAALEQKKTGAKGATLKLINQEIANLENLRTSELDILEITKSQVNQYKLRQEEIKRSLEYSAELLNKEQAGIDSLGDSINTILTGSFKKMREEQEASANKALPELQRRLAAITQEERNLAEAAKERVAAQFENDPEGLMAAQMAIEGAQKTATERRQRQAEETYNQQRLFATGWEEAFTAYADSAGNAAKQAGDYFNRFSSGFETAIVKFVQTGKLSFKDLANSLIADFARIAAQKMFLSLFGGPTGGGILGNFFGFGGIGKAGGGPVMAGKPYMVGESGREMFIPNSAGSIVPNNQLNGGGATTVNYNIQAVDAASFRSLVARDPSFIYAVTEQGRRSQPSRSR
jgi:hypothetical protein